MTKRTMYLYLFILGFISFQRVAFASFSDVTSLHSNADAITYMQTSGMVEGYSDGTYRPDQTINRAEFTKIIAMAYGTEERDRCVRQRDLGKMFSDMRSTDWYASYVCVANMHDVINGYPDRTFRGASLVNFAEAAKMLTFRYNLYGDVTDIWYERGVRALEGRGTIPLSIGSFNQPITRGEMAEMIYRLDYNITTKPSKTYTSLQSGQNVFSLPQYNFSIAAITEKDCRWTQLGPNDTQRRQDAGEQISGTIPPARNVIAFDCEGTIAPDFELSVYENHNFAASMDGTWDGACGTQFAESNIVNRYVVPDGPGASYLEVIQSLFDGSQQADYCFDLGNDTMITLRWIMKDYNKVIDEMERIADSVSLQ